MPGMEGYSPDIQSVLKKLHAAPGSRIEVSRADKSWTGTVMPRIQGDPDTLILKLDNGYNIGIKYSENVKISKVAETQKEPAVQSKTGQSKADPKKPTIAVLHTGGTIASKLDYRTGAVQPLFTAEEIVGMYPELSAIANIRARVVFQMASDDMESSHWTTLAREVHKEIIEEGCNGIIITQGTDTIHYTAAALSFMLKDLPVPVLIVGSQRSADRPSSDAGMNLISAVRFIAGSDWTGVGVCMHGSSSDEFCYVLPGTRVKKMHTSRRDTFRPIDTKPIAKIYWNLNTVEMISKNYQKKDPARIPKLDNVFEPHVSLVKIYPGFRADELEWHIKNRHGIVLEGTGLGHAPINHTDEATKDHPELLKLLEKAKGKCFIFMTSQCAYGRVNLNVYSPGRALLQAGVLPAYMTPETAYVKLGWVLAHTRDRSKVKDMMAQNVAGEQYGRSELEDFPDKQMEE